MAPGCLLQHGHRLQPGGNNTETVDAILSHRCLPLVPRDRSHHRRQFLLPDGHRYAFYQSNLDAHSDFPILLGQPIVTVHRGPRNPVFLAREPRWPLKNILQPATLDSWGTKNRVSDWPALFLELYGIVTDERAFVKVCQPVGLSFGLECCILALVVSKMMLQLSFGHRCFVNPP
jgi:hypothetical protein